MNEYLSLSADESQNRFLLWLCSSESFPTPSREKSIYSGFVKPELNILGKPLAQDACNCKMMSIKTVDFVCLSSLLIEKDAGEIGKFC